MANTYHGDHDLKKKKLESTLPEGAFTQVTPFLGHAIGFYEKDF